MEVVDRCCSIRFVLLGLCKYLHLDNQNAVSGDTFTCKSHQITVEYGLRLSEDTFGMGRSTYLRILRSPEMRFGQTFGKQTINRNSCGSLMSQILQLSKCTDSWHKSILIISFVLDKKPVRNQLRTISSLHGFEVVFWKSLKDR